MHRLTRHQSSALQIPTVTVFIGDVLTATEGTFADSDGDASAGPTWRWNDGATDLGHGDSYTISAGYLGKTIKLFAIPNTNPDVTDPAVDIEVGGGTAAAVNIAAEDDVVSVAITGFDASTGFPIVGAALTAAPSCVGQCGTLNYQWQIEDNIGSGNYVNIKDATSDTYALGKEDQKRKIQVVVTKP